MSQPSCPQHSQCVSAYYSSGFGPICKCNSKFGPDEEGKKCVPVNIYEEACEVRKTDNGRDKDSCDTSNGLECKYSKCTCAEGSRWEARSGRCGVTVENTCSSSSSSSTHRQCGMNAHCSYRSVPSARGYGNDYESKCECLKGFSSVDGFRFAKYLDKCRRNEDCFDGMRCIDRHCRCSKPLTQKVSPDGKFCANIVGSPC
jgi:hypothetical protein